MKKKIITCILLLGVLLMLVLIVRSFKISMVFDENGDMVSDGTFSISFEGCGQYTDEELAGYLFQEKYDSNPIVFLWNDKFGEQVQIPFIEEYDVEMDGLFKYKITFYEKSVVGYIKYMGSNMYFDKDGIVVESSKVLLEGVPYVTGIDVDHIILHSELPVRDGEVFDILLDITQLIKKYEISVDKINVSEDLELKLYIGPTRVDLGNAQNLSEKIVDLRDIIPSLTDDEGVLNMREYDLSGNGYSFRKD